MRKIRFISWISCFTVLASCFYGFSVSAAGMNEAAAIAAFTDEWKKLTATRTELLATPNIADTSCKATADSTELTEEEKAAFGEYYYHITDGMKRGYSAAGGSFKDYSGNENVKYSFRYKVIDSGSGTSFGIKFYNKNYNAGSKWPSPTANTLQGMVENAVNIDGLDVRNTAAIEVEPNGKEVYIGCIYASYDEPIALPEGYEFFSAEDWVNAVYATDLSDYNVTDEFKASFAELQTYAENDSKILALKKAYSNLETTKTELYAIPNENYRYSTEELSDEERTAFGEYYYVNATGSSEANYQPPVGQAAFADYSGKSNVKYTFRYKQNKAGNFQVKLSYTKTDGTSGEINTWDGKYAPYSDKINTILTYTLDTAGTDISKNACFRLYPNGLTLTSGCIYVSYDEALALPYGCEYFTLENWIKAVYATDLSACTVTDEFKSAFAALKDESILARADINGDYRFNSVDMLVLRKRLLGAYKADYNFDLNGDGSTDICDLIKIKKMLANREEDTMTGAMMKSSFVSDTFKVNEKTEIKVDIEGLDPALNVYDEKDVDLSISLVSANGTKIELPGFYYEEYEFSDDGTLTGKTENKGDFRFRVSLTEAGEWDFVITLKLRGELTDTVFGKLVAEGNTESHGYLSVEPNRKQSFIFTDGTPYVAIGENIAWADVSNKGAVGAQMIEWMKKCAENGANFARIWLICWCGLTIQKNDYAPNDFTGGLSAAAQLDRIFDAWRDIGMYGELCMFSFNLLNNTEGSTEAAWHMFPYNAANKYGYLEKPVDFFTNEKAIEDTKTYLRYLVARYSYSANLHSWEFFNEVDGATGAAQSTEAVVKWHEIMSGYLRSIDPYKHMITTSTACYPGNANKNDSELKNRIHAQEFFDFVSIHRYDYNTVKELSDYLSNMQRLYSRPTMYGECGLTRVLLDEDLITFHQQNWMGIMAGGSGTAMTWYWERLDKYNGYGQFRPLRTVTDMIPWNNTGLSAITVNDSNFSAVSVNYLGYRTDEFACLWLYDSKYTQSNKVARSIGGVNFSVNLKNGEYCVKWIDTYTSNIVSETRELVKNGNLKLFAPDWNKDIAVVITTE